MPVQKKCKACREPFTALRPMQCVCSPKCAVADLERKKAKAQQVERRETARAIASIKPRSQLIKEAQAAINAYVRARDAHLPCVSCDKPATWNGQWHASHFRSTAAASSIRFHLWNIHKACNICNNWKSGNLLEYQDRLVAKIGSASVEWLKQQNVRSDYSREYLIRLKKIFARKAAREQRKAC